MTRGEEPSAAKRWMRWFQESATMRCPVDFSTVTPRAFAMPASSGESAGFGKCLT